jgi:hypothetical protein
MKPHPRLYQIATGRQSSGYALFRLDFEIPPVQAASTHDIWADTVVRRLD